MSVDSYLELFTTLFGWTFYGVLWDVLVATGIVYLPFLGILIDNWREPAEGGQFGTVTGLSLRRMEIDLFIALLVVVLAGQPAALNKVHDLLDDNPGLAAAGARQYQHVLAFSGHCVTLGIVERGEDIGYVHQGILSVCPDC